MNSINSSDDLRTDKFSKYIEEFEIPFTLNLERGDQLENVKVAYETYGELNQDKSNSDSGPESTNEPEEVKNTKSK